MNSHVMACRFLDYCDENSATVDVERKEKVEDIADTLRGLKLLSAASSGRELILILLNSTASPTNIKSFYKMTYAVASDWAFNPNFKALHNFCFRMQ